MERKFLRDYNIKKAQNACGIGLSVNATKFVDELINRIPATSSDIGHVKEIICKAAQSIPEDFYNDISHYGDIRKIIGDSILGGADLNDVISIINNLNKILQELQNIASASAILDVKYDDIISYAQTKKVLSSELIPENLKDQQDLVLATQGMGSLLVQASNIYLTMPQEDSSDPQFVYKFIIDCFALLYRDVEKISSGLKQLSGIKKEALSYMNVFEALDDAVNLRSTNKLGILLAYMNALFPDQEQKMFEILELLLQPVLNTLGIAIEKQTSNLKGSKGESDAVNLALNSIQVDSYYARWLMSMKGILQKMSEQSTIDSLNTTTMMQLGNYLYFLTADELKNIKGNSSNSIGQQRKSSINNLKFRRIASIADFTDFFSHASHWLANWLTDSGASQSLRMVPQEQDARGALNNYVVNDEIGRNLDMSLQSAVRASAPADTSVQDIQSYTRQLENQIVTYYFNKMKDANPPITTAKQFSDWIITNSGTDALNDFYRFYTDTILKQLTPNSPDYGAGVQKGIHKELSGLAKNYQQPLNSLELLLSNFQVMFTTFNNSVTNISPKSSNTSLFPDTDILFGDVIFKDLDALIEQGQKVIEQSKIVFGRIISDIGSSQITDPKSEYSLQLKSMINADVVKIITMMRDIQTSIKKSIELEPNVKLKVIDSSLNNLMKQSELLKQTNPYLANMFGVAIASKENQAILILEDFMHDLRGNKYFTEFTKMLDEIEKDSIMQTFFGNKVEAITGKLYNGFNGFFDSVENNVQSLIADRRMRSIIEMQKSGLIKR